MRRRGGREKSPGSEKSARQPPEGSTELVPTTAAEDVFSFVLERPDKIRERAQYTSAVAGIVAAATTAAALSNRVPPGPTVVLVVAAGVWGIALFLWIHAIGGPLKPAEQHLYADEHAVDLSGAIERALANADDVRKRLTVARWVTGIATAITVAGLTWAAEEVVAASRETNADISLTPPGAQGVRAAVTSVEVV